MYWLAQPWAESPMMARETPFPLKKLDEQNRQRRLVELNPVPVGLAIHPHVLWP